MNILVLNPVMYTGSLTTYEIPKVESLKDTMMYNMCLGFKHNGHKVTLAVAEEYRPVKKEQYDFEIKFFKSNFKKIFPPVVIPFSFELIKYIKKNKNRFDIIITSDAFSFVSIFASIIAPTKTLIWHEIAKHQKKFHQIPSKFIYNVICPLIMRNCLVVPRSHDAYNFIRKYLKKVSSTPVEHGINGNVFQPGSIKEKQFVVIAQLIKRKNISSIIDKFGQFLKKYDSEYKLYILGRGPLKEQLEEEAKKVHADKNIIFTGQLPHLKAAPIISSSAAMLIDTLQDNNMVSIPETIACGTPILTNSIPTNSSYIKDLNCGIVKDKWNEDDMFKIANDKIYSESCVKNRYKFLCEHQAELMIKIWNDLHSKKNF